MSAGSTKAVNLISSPRTLGAVLLLSAGLWTAKVGLAAQVSDGAPKASPGAPRGAKPLPVGVGQHPAAAKATSAAKRSTAVKRSAAARHLSATRSSRKTAHATRRSRPLSYRRRLAKLRPEPQRVTEIQRALIQAGYLHQEPTSTWDQPTRQAMQRFQQDHGFPTTGLPEAKSLMKLGLGPHPLPEDSDPSTTARASAGASSPPSASPSADPAPARREQ